MLRSRGTQVVEGEHATLTFRRTYRHAPQHVWDALTTAEGLRAWLMCTHVDLEPRVGGRIELVSGQGRYHSRGRILAWDPPHVLEYEWNIEPVPEMPRGENAVFRFALTADGASTHLLVTYRRITVATARGFLPGLHAYLDRLEAQLDGAPLPDFLTRFSELRAEYPEWSGHAPDTGE